jgi:thioredoxin 1
MLTLTQANFDDTIATGKVFVAFGSPACGHCKVIRPIVEKLSKEYAGRAIIGNVDIDVEENLSTRYDITTVPTFIVFEDSVAVDRKEGPQSLEVMERMIGY